jgi:hypothetical protein
MARERDQEAARKAAAVQEPCAGCTRRTTCLVRFAYRILAELELPDARQTHLLSACSWFESAPGAPVGADIRPELAAAGIADLCDGCPETTVCGPHLELAELKGIAAQNGILIDFTTVTCTTARTPKRRLLQIIEPAADRGIDTEEE